MNKRLVGTIGALLAAVTLARPARAEEPAVTPQTPAATVSEKVSPFTLTAEVDVKSIYNSNGGTFFSKGPALQHVATGCYKTLCLTLWGNHDLDMKKYNETDIFLEYSHDLWGKGTIKGGVLEFALFPREGNQNSTQEAYLSYTPPNGPEVRFHKHFNQSNGWVLKGVYSKAIDAAVLTLTAGHNHHYWTFENDGRDGRGNFAELNLALPLKISETLTLSPSVSCQAATGTLESKCWGNVGLVYTMPSKKSDDGKKQ